MSEIDIAAPASGWRKTEANTRLGLRLLWKKCWGKNRGDIYRTAVHETIDGPASFMYINLRDTELHLLFPQQQILLIRKEYMDLVKLFLSYCNSKEAPLCLSVILTAMNRSGKSNFMRLLLMERMFTGLPTLFQNSDQYIYELNAKGVTPWDIRDLGEKISFRGERLREPWALIETGEYLARPHHLLSSSESDLFRVVTVPCVPVQNWSQWMEDENAKVIAMEPWSWPEVDFIISRLPGPFNTQLLYENFIRYGPCISRCFLLCKPDRLASFEARVKSSVGDLGIDVLVAQTLPDTALETFPLAVYPAPDTDRIPTPTLTSHYILDLVTPTLHKRKVEARRDFYRLVVSVPDMRSTGGYMWERLLLRTLSEGPQGEADVARLPSPPNRKFALRYPIGKATPFGTTTRSLAVELRGRSTDLPAVLCPTSPNQATFDAIILLGDRTVLLIQATVSSSHQVKATGLDFVWEAFTEADMREWLPGPSKWHLIFAVPNSVRGGWNREQSITPSSKNRKWEDYIRQYILSPRECDLFR
ncbi:hypothetical protein BOTBODRAFT_170957 [Botryobasidium botryosum FD-172 SS1]|uniref:Uncharacterized protein n=1 Tax=Botryobasidium botryosum (strain FD-172 SS1) TaxID=930990 RepID=A0A067N5D8_BOTB1|nr:hypothetical protein BOTBODRAFT_170957 [Botryobasidium botryosum FD-172 SS1]